VCMHHEEHSRRHCVLPFQATPGAVGELRRAVRAQLGTWGLAHLADLVELALSELATNVVRHVGVGTPATCTLEAQGEHLRLEMYDVSVRVPERREAVELGEAGRGLALVEAVSDAWGVSPMAGGKRVWCELADWADTEARDARRRVQRASRAVESYMREPLVARHTLRSVLTAEETATGLIADLLHWLAAQGGDTGEILEWAQARFDAGVDQQRRSALQAVPDAAARIRR
jgi:anti-sigma regulatory factor (Ser/Thr protein kinase)